LFPKKDEGKKVMEGKEEGRGNLPLFGTNEKHEGKKGVDGTHAQMLSAPNWTESGKKAIILLK
jgi:hypothetical protein